MTPGDSSRSRAWKENPHPRYWWHRLPGTDYVPAIYLDLSEPEWTVLANGMPRRIAAGPIGECAVPLISLLHGLVMGNRTAASRSSGHAPAFRSAFGMDAATDERGAACSPWTSIRRCARCRGAGSVAPGWKIFEIAEGSSLDGASIEPRENISERVRARHSR